MLESSSRPSPLDYVHPEYELLRDSARCTGCRLCERQCANGVTRFDERRQLLISDSAKCVNCQRCVCVCPTHALKVAPSGNVLRKNANWTPEIVTAAIRQAGTGGALLASMGTPAEYPVYWDRLLINASQVTNPSIDPLREPMETRVFLGKRPDRVTRRPDGSLRTELPPPALAGGAGALLRHVLRIHLL